jgi:hypothetical protein
MKNCKADANIQKEKGKKEEKNGLQCQNKDL